MKISRHKTVARTIAVGTAVAAAGIDGGAAVVVVLALKARSACCWALTVRVLHRHYGRVLHHCALLRRLVLLLHDEMTLTHPSCDDWAFLRPLDRPWTLPGSAAGSSQTPKWHHVVVPTRGTTVFLGYSLESSPEGTRTTCQ